MDEPENAQQVMEPALADAPEDVGLLTLMATTLSRRGMHQSASDLLERALALTGGAAEVKTDLGLNELKRGNTERALQLLHEAFADGAGHRPAGNALVLWYMREGRHAEAVEAGGRLVDSRPGDVQARNLYGSALVGFGDVCGGGWCGIRHDTATSALCSARIHS